MADYHFGEVEGYPVGSSFANRTEAMKAGVHQLQMQGISGNAREGANSIVVNGGYEDDEDHGSTIIYTGAGGNDTSTGKQVADQTFTKGNAALAVSEALALPVRVLRGSKGEPAYSPSAGFRYDGLFRVEAHWAEKGKSGFTVWRYRLRMLDPAASRAFTPPANLPPGTSKPSRASGVVQRIVRDTEMSKAVKRLHDYRCQVCALRMDLPAGVYAEGAHIRALGRPHDGPDTPDNLLCLCPNHHVLFDKGAIYVDEDLEVRDYLGGSLGKLLTVTEHQISALHLRYHREGTGLI